MTHQIPDISVNTTQILLICTYQDSCITRAYAENVAIERFWRSIKYEDIYLKSYETARDLARGIKSYIIRYNQYRPHQSLSEATPEEIYSGKMKIAM